MLSKSQIKHIRSLTQQKYRKEYNAFIAEGDKIAREWLNSNARIQHIIALKDWVNEHEQLIAKHDEAEVSVVDEHVLSSVSTLQSANKALLVVNLPDKTHGLPTSGWSIALDHIQDPGNMGTIIRIADWFNVRYVILSPGCVDVYNPKVVQAAMGGHLRVHFIETDLHELVRASSVPVLAATLNGESLYKQKKFADAILLIGNESKGLDNSLTELTSHRITIPGGGGAESLNAAISAGIICSHLIPDRL